jgi:hypothetical protein
MIQNLWSPQNKWWTAETMGEESVFGSHSCKFYASLSAQSSMSNTTVCISRGVTSFE